MGCLSSKPTTPLPRVVTRNTLNSYHLEIMPEQLKELMELKGKDAVTAVNRKYDGVQGLCRKLGVNPCEGTKRRKYFLNTLQLTSLLLC